MSLRTMRDRILHNRGFTLVELMVVMAISMFVLVAASKVMISMTSQFKQQSRIAGKSMESGFGLELMRKDISAAGFGLPTGIFNGGNSFNGRDWSVINGTYTELDSTVSPGSSYDSFDKPPKMIDARAPGTVTHGLNNSSYIVIRSAAVGTDPIAGKYYLLKQMNNSPGPTLSKWELGYDAGDDPYRDPDIESGSGVIVITTVDSKNMGLVTRPQYQQTGSLSYKTTPGTISTGFGPINEFDTYVVYGLNSRSSNLRAPFNRVDYYVGNTEVPQKCATNTGVLYRAGMNHDTGKLDAPIRVMDCVALMYVVFGFDSNGDGTIDELLDTLYTKTASYIRKFLVKVDVYILTHEGQFEPSYEYRDELGTGKIEVGGDGFVREFNASGLVYGGLVNNIPFWKHFRWRVYKLSVRPMGRGTY